MALNKYQPHLYVIPEDDANRQICVGFQTSHFVRSRVIQVMPNAGGWSKVIECIRDEYLPLLRRNEHCHVLGIMDCDDETNRLHESLDKFPDELRARLFLIGALAEPEILKRQVEKPFEDLGRQLAEECCTDNYQIWSNRQFVHCADQIQRLSSKLRPWLFAVESSNG